MEGPVVAAIISSSVAVLVAVTSAVRADLQRATDRRYERRRAFLVDAQDAVLALRDALREYGAAAQQRRDLDIVAELDRARRIAAGRLTVAVSRVEDSLVSEAIAGWTELAQISLIDPREGSAAKEEAAFDDINTSVGLALRSTRGTGRASAGR